MSQEPIRLIDDPSTAALLRGDLGHGAHATVSGLDVSAGVAQLGAAILAQPAVAAAGTSTGVTAKILIGAALVGGAVALWVGMSTPTRSVETPIAATQPEASDTPSKVGRAVIPEAPGAVIPEAPAPKVETPVLAPAEEEAPIVVEEAAEEPRRTTDERKAAKKPPAAESFDDAAGREAMLVGDAKKALRNGNGARVLELVAQADGEFPKGQLVQERRALEIRALAQLGRADEASTKAKTFLSRYPASPYADAVKRAVGQ